MGPYCKFCNQRCFVPLPANTPPLILEAYASSTIAATCPQGKMHERHKLGYCYDDIIMDTAHLNPAIACPCSTIEPWKPCSCREIIAGTQTSKSPIELLKARYTAFATCEVDFIIATTHPRTRESKEFDETSIREWAKSSNFTRLKIYDTVSESEDVAYVTFEAHFTQHGQRSIHRERSRFERQNNEWFFADGEALKPKTVRYDAPQPGRNQPCSCGSGKKFKKCCAK